MAELDLALWVHAICALFMTGLIWCVQVVHYPLFALVGADGYPAYQASHVSRMGWVVGPPMLLEAASAAALVAIPSGQVEAGVAWCGLVLLGVVWLTTALYSVPAHTRLAEGFHGPSHQRLVRTNWIRTIGWTLRSAVAIYLVLAAG